MNKELERGRPGVTDTEMDRERERERETDRYMDVEGREREREERRQRPRLMDRHMDEEWEREGRDLARNKRYLCRIFVESVVVFVRFFHCSFACLNLLFSVRTLGCYFALIRKAL